jgi:hypothetical protein
MWLKKTPVGARPPAKLLSARSVVRMDDAIAALSDRELVRPRATIHLRSLLHKLASGAKKIITASVVPEVIAPHFDSVRRMASSLTGAPAVG